MLRFLFHVASLLAGPPFLPFPNLCSIGHENSHYKGREHRMNLLKKSVCADATNLAASLKALQASAILILKILEVMECGRPVR